MHAGRKRQPLDLILANGKHHFSEREIAERRSKELSVPFKNVKAPSYLTKEQKREFNAYAKKLVALNIFTELDVDVLAQYVIALDLYTQYSAQIKEIVNKAAVVNAWNVIDELASDLGCKDDLVELLSAIVRRQRSSELSALTILQDKAFKQCVTCARELGLTITSRAKIEVPAPPEGEDDEL
jgi:P27 family predicted phage terminase small subunit